MRNFETFTNEQGLLGKIEQLRSNGVSERHMKVISKNRLEGSALHYTDVEYKNAEGSFGDKVAAFFTGEDPEDRVFDNLNLNANERSEYKNAIDRGDIVLLVDDESEYNNSANYSSTHPQDSQRGNEYYDGHNKGTVAGNVHTHTNGEDNMNNKFDRVDNNLHNDNLKHHELDEDIRNRTDLSDEEKIKLHEERLLVNKDRVQTGEVTVEKDVVTERQEFDVPVEREEVTIERRPVNERTTGDFDSLDNDEVVKVPVHEERLNVQKENVVNEEIVVKKNKVTDVEHVSEDVRREEVDIDESNRGHLNDRDLDNHNRL